MSSSISFLPGHFPTNPGPLARYLPPLQDGSGAAWLRENISPGSWVLDPFGASPRLAVEAAQAGYRVLVAANNPIERFLLEITANPPSENELRAALADLAVTPKAGEHIEPHIRSLYTTECAQCGQPVMAEAFIWERDAAAPSSRIYHCPNCKDSGEHPVNQYDVERASQFASSKLHHARALERVTPLDDPDRVHVEEALLTYPPRAMYALITLINKLESLSHNRRRLVDALLLAAFDQANTLWHYPITRARPRQLNIPTRYREKNVWLALEEAVEQWAVLSTMSSFTPQLLPLVAWPESPPMSGGISLFEGRLRDLADQVHQSPPSDFKINAVLAALPRPNQAYWTLSALWAGWLWGHEASAPFKSVLRRRRYDWAWHTTALHVVFKNLIGLLEPATPCLGLVGEIEMGYLAAAIIAAEMAGFELSDVALRAEIGQAQIFWQPPAKETPGQLLPSSKGHLQELGHRAIQAYLNERGQPAETIYVYAAALTALAYNHCFLPSQDQTPADVFGEVQNTLQQTLLNRSNFFRYGGSERSLESGYWWLTHAEKGSVKPEETIVSLADRVEMALVRYLIKHPGCTYDELDQAICASFTGLFTPDSELLQACLSSYGEQFPLESRRWQLRNQDEPKIRRQDLENIHELLIQLGLRLGFEIPDSQAAQKPGQPSEPQAIVWREPGSTTKFTFYILASALLGKIIFLSQESRLAGTNQLPENPSRQFIVIPGGRVALIGFKLRSDPRLKSAIESNWQLIKFRHIRRLAENILLTKNNLNTQLNLDLLANTDPQLPLW